MRRRVLAIATVALGLALILVGVALIFPPLSLILAGIFVLGAASFDPTRIRRLTWPR